MRAPGSRAPRSTGSEEIPKTHEHDALAGLSPPQREAIDVLRGVDSQCIQIEGYNDDVFIVDETDTGYGRVVGKSEVSQRSGAGGVDLLLVLVGHSHCYERSFLLAGSPCEYVSSGTLGSVVLDLDTHRLDVSSLARQIGPHLLPS